MGVETAVDPSVQLTKPERISLGDGVAIWPHTIIHCAGEESAVRIGHRTVIDQGVIIKTLNFDRARTTAITVGERVLVGPYTCIWGPGDIEIGNDTLISPHCSIVANVHLHTRLDRPIREQGVARRGITIGPDCWLGSGVSVMDGVTIGRGCVIGAGSVVARDIPDYSIAAGVPARVVDRRSPDGQARD